VSGKTSKRHAWRHDGRFIIGYDNSRHPQILFVTIDAVTAPEAGVRQAAWE
jgi:hypothetical protein